MAYTVNKLAKLSGVSTRTLRFYDEIGLLKPAYLGDNSYRYYQEEQLLMLQQILFYRELGFPLDEIQRVISSSDFDKVSALKSHKKILEQSLDQTKTLIKTIEKTISHLGGKVKMTNEEFYYGFDSEKQKSYEEHLVNSGKVKQEMIDKSKEKVKHWTEEDWDRFKQDGDALIKEFVSAIEKKLKPEDPEVQKLVKRHYQTITLFWTPTKESYLGLGQLYSENPDFHKFYDRYHSKMVRFLVQAMEVFAKNELS